MPVAEKRNCWIAEKRSCWVAEKRDYSAKGFSWEEWFQ
jgi:hypothetical protein